MSQLAESRYNIDKRKTKYAFAEFPSVKLFKSNEGSAWCNHLLYGDYIKILDTSIVTGRVKVRSRNRTGWANISDLQKERIMEVNFVDIGQGDGCHIVTPDDQHILIDAGKGDNMNRYLTWRFNLYKRKSPMPFPFTVIISHSDSDHYKGFGHIFDNPKIKIDKIYHNGLVERPGHNPLGEVSNGFITGLVKTSDQMREIINISENRKGKGSLYCKTLYKSNKYNDADFHSLSTNDDYLNGFDRQTDVNNKELSIRILGPIVSMTNGKESLQSINNLGKDKNGHSVILKLIYGKAKVLLGGDVNTEFGQIIFDHYQAKNDLDSLVVDVAKACHHGSNHFHYGFIEAINASATVISSGDNESYAHPRPDAIGALGKCGYGIKPLIFSTELARSNKEITIGKLEKISKLLSLIKETKAKIKLETDQVEIKLLKTKLIKANKEINSFLTKYGMINVRTNGEKMIIAQKYESPSAHGKWDIHKLIYSNESNRFEMMD